MAAKVSVPAQIHHDLSWSALMYDPDVQVQASCALRGRLGWRWCDRASDWWLWWPGQVPWLHLVDSYAKFHQIPLPARYYSKHPNGRYYVRKASEDPFRATPHWLDTRWDMVDMNLTNPTKPKHIYIYICIIYICIIYIYICIINIYMYNIYIYV